MRRLNGVSNKICTEELWRFVFQRAKIVLWSVGSIINNVTMRINVTRRIDGSLPNV